jgi:hypothetical protein
VCGIEQVLKIVNDEQQLAIAQGHSQSVRQPLSPDLDHAKGQGDCASDEGRVADDSEGHEDRAEFEAGAELTGELEAESGLADAPGAGQRH